VDQASAETSFKIAGGSCILTGMLSKTVLLPLLAALVAGSVPAGSLISVTGSPGLFGTEGTALSATLGTFTDAGGADALSNYSVTVNWGDSTSSAGAVTGSSTFTITGSHTYADEGSYTVGLSVVDSDGASGNGVGSANISDAALSLLSANTIVFTPGVGFTNANLGSFQDANGFGATSDFNATINWGDNTSSAGVIQGSPASFSVTGSHTYASPGAFPVNVTINDDGGNSVQIHAEANSPEPASWGLALLGLAAVAIRAARRQGIATRW